MREYFGKYRGKVQNNIDPKKMGRIQVSVPAVLGDGFLSWAMPCVPYAGPGVGFFAIPPLQANIWVEFEGGNTDYPIWSGCFWGVGEVPAVPAEPTTKMFKTESVTFSINDLPGGGVELHVLPPAVPSPLSLICNAEGVTINALPSSVKIGPQLIQILNGAQNIKISPASVSVNDGALDII